MTIQQGLAESTVLKIKEKPKNVAPHLWEKFQLLEKRTNETTQRSTEKRIKHLQKQVMDTVTTEFTTPEDKDILRQYDVKFGPPVEKKTERKRKAKDEIKSTDTSGSSKSEVFEGIGAFMNVNGHLVQTDFSRPPPPTALEKRIDNAIIKGDIATAETLSDHLAKREFGQKLVSAIDAKRFLEQKKIEEESSKMKKKKKLNWGFEPKQRWETKGNM
ncbi:unnamed protein product [Lymnaea stagnalis]|uniref:Protein FAM204A n=1 Tax=Lymnaea stagnalis TaxID=6523 RepID=A0AAV2GYA2_LYMST